MHILITGGAGFIGSHLVDLHMGRGDNVTVVDDLSTGREANIAAHCGRPGFAFHKAALEDWDGLGKALETAERVYHLAAVVGVRHVLEDPVRVISVNQSATERLLKIMADKGSKAPVIVASSSEVYGFDEREKFGEDDDLVIPSVDKLRWCYAVTKLADEMLAFAYHHRHGLNTVTVRLFNTIGQRQTGRYGMVVPHFVEQAVKGVPITVYGNGHQTRSFCDVRDTVRMLDALAGTPQAWGQVINVGNDQEITIEDLALMIKEKAGSASEISHMSYQDAYGVDYHDIQHRRPDLSRLSSLTGLAPGFRTQETIEQLVQSYRAIHGGAKK